jgi:hypothetical protein
MKKLDAGERAVICGHFSNEVATCRDMLQPIIDGLIERGHCQAGQQEAYGGVRGKRKTTLVDARKIAKTIVVRLNRALNEFDKDMEADL